MLEIERLHSGYGRDPVLRGIDLAVRAGEIVALIGANGAGKSTLMKTISGLTTMSAGAIRFDGRRIDALGSARRVALGIAHVPEGRQIFPALTVAENLRLGGYAAARPRDIAEVCAPFPVLIERQDEIAANLSGGQQQMLAICRGLMSAPKLLLLDEPSLGLSPILVAEIFRIVAELKTRNIAILLAEQNARQSLAIADRGYVLEGGRIVMAGPARDLLANPALAEKYFGVGAAVAAAESGAMAERLRAILR